MKIFGTDFKLKYVIAEIEGKELLVSFYDTRWKGVHNVTFRIDKQEVQSKIISTYPGFVQRIREAALIIRVQLKHTINRISKRNG